MAAMKYRAPDERIQSTVRRRANATYTPRPRYRLARRRTLARG